jgi:hypothetical protein
MALQLRQRINNPTRRAKPWRVRHAAIQQQNRRPRAQMRVRVFIRQLRSTRHAGGVCDWIPLHAFYLSVLMVDDWLILGVADWVSTEHVLYVIRVVLDTPSPAAGFAEVRVVELELLRRVLGSDAGHADPGLGCGGGMSFLLSGLDVTLNVPSGVCR